MNYICCEQRGGFCNVHHGEDTDVIKNVGYSILTQRYVVYDKIINECYSQLCATKNEVKWTVDKLINCNVLTETYDSINLPQEEKKYVWLFIELPDKNKGRI